MPDERAKLVGRQPAVVIGVTRGEEEVDLLRRRQADAQIGAHRGDRGAQLVALQQPVAVGVTLCELRVLKAAPLLLVAQQQLNATQAVLSAHWPHEDLLAFGRSRPTYVRPARRTR